MPTVPKKFGFLRTTLALWGASLFAGRAGIVTDSTPGPVERWGWYDGAAWKFSARSGANESFGSLALSSYITLNGATRPAWSFWAVPIQLSNQSAIYTIAATGGDQVGFARNFYTAADGFQKAIASYTGKGYPTQFHLDDNGRLRFFASQTDPVAGSTVSDLSLRFEVNRFGGAGFFGVSAPTVRPTVNAACTDLATCIALTNQLRTHLIACGLVQ